MERVKTTYGFGMKYFRKNMPLMIIGYLLAFIAIIVDLILPLVTGLFIDAVIVEGSAKNSLLEILFKLTGKELPLHSFELFKCLAILTGILVLIRIVCIYCRNVIYQFMGLRMETEMRIKTYKKLMSLDSQTLSEYNSGELLQTMNGDIIHFKEMFCRMIPTIIEGVFALGVSVFLLGRMSLWLLIVPLGLAPVFIFELTKFKKIAGKNFTVIRSNNSRMNLTVQENIEALRLVRSFTNEKYELEKFNKANEELKNSHLNQIQLSAKFEAVFSSLKQAVYIGTIAVCTLLIFNGNFSVGFLVACSNYVLKIMNQLTQINMMLFVMQQQTVAGQKIKAFFEKESKVEEKKNIDEEIIHPNISVKNLCVEMDENKILSDINLEIPYGKKIGIAGSTGSGKSILLETLVRNYSATSGEILVNGKNVQDYSLNSLRKIFAYVFQEAFLFSNTVQSNIKYAVEKSTELESEISDEEMEKIIFTAKRARAHRFIMNLENGYKTVVGERGIGISGGQKQRLTIARALMKESPVLVLDDSTSALDVETERKLLETIRTYYPEKTLLISAHRLSSIIDCDEIIYLDEGKIVERGTFDELIKLNGHFAKIYNIQIEQQTSVLNYGENKEK